MPDDAPPGPMTDGHLTRRGVPCQTAGKGYHEKCSAMFRHRTTEMLVLP